ncbi:MAG: DUF805 domain-containing protein [Commensalibacter sp.]|nr:DUF805 domain-containing protein [Commensalibacter sp.]
MRGFILNFIIQTNTGYISGDDGQRYEFSGDEWKENIVPQKGTCVDFQVNQLGRAVAVFILIDDKNVHFMNKIQSRTQYEQKLENEKNYTIIGWFSKCIRNYVNFEGRARRTEFWSFQICYWAVFFIGLLIIGLLFSATIVQTDTSFDGILMFEVCLYLSIFLWSVFSIVMFIPMISVAVRRLHDINLSGFWLLLHFIPVGSIAVWIMFCIDTKYENNQWGPPAKLKYR